MLKSGLLSNYERWKLILNKSSNSNNETKFQNCEKFLKQFPFCGKVWGISAHIRYTLDGKQGCLEQFKKAFKYNPYFLPLHINYCYWVEDAFKDQPEMIEQTFKDSLEKVGHNFEVNKIYMQYIKFLRKKNKYIECDQVFWKLLDGNMYQINSFISQYDGFLQMCDDVTMNAIYKKHFAGDTDEAILFKRDGRVSNVQT
jgi:hypothetical protein